MSKEDKETLSKIEQPPLQHVNALRWYNQCRHEMGVTTNTTTASECAACPVEAAPVDAIGAAYSKVVDPALLPAMKAQRDPKTGQLKDEPSFIKHRMDLFDQLYAEQQKRYEAKEKKPIKITLPDGAVIFPPTQK